MEKVGISLGIFEGQASTPLALAGTGVLAVGLWLRFDERTKGLFTGVDAPTVFLTGVYILIVAGAVMMVVGFLGCCGAIRESACMLGLIVKELQDFYTQTFNNYKDTKQEALRETLRAIQYGSCPDAIKEIFTSRLHVIGGVGIGIGVVMIFGMIFSMLLCCSIRRTREMI
ncbi:hypothetical protein cypCar_00047029 [Cyprinus carpio]|nr:hypothetical protein cypCar_00047029 [Cyprinus carpio]